VRKYIWIDGPPIKTFAPLPDSIFNDVEKYVRSTYDERNAACEAAKEHGAKIEEELGKAGLLTVGTELTFANGRRAVIGDVNTLLGECECCPLTFSECGGLISVRRLFSMEEQDENPKPL
jgi:hypothetical protein